MDQYESVIRIALRVLGVLFIVEGATGIVGNGIELWDQTRLVRSGEMIRVSGYTVGWFVSSIFQFGAGLYLLLDGRIFLAAIGNEPPTDDDEPNPIPLDRNE